VDKVGKSIIFTILFLAVNVKFITYRLRLATDELTKQLCALISSVKRSVS